MTELTFLLPVPGMRLEVRILVALPGILTARFVLGRRGLLQGMSFASLERVFVRFDLRVWRMLTAPLPSRGAPQRGSYSLVDCCLASLWAVFCGPIRSSGRLPGACSNLSSSPLALHGVVSASPVCLSRAPAFRQVRVAMLAEGSVESPSVLVLAFHSSLFLVEGSSDGSAPGDRSSPLHGCVYSLRFRLRSVASALSLLGSWAFLPPLSVPVGHGGTFPRGNCSEFP